MSFVKIFDLTAGWSVFFFFSMWKALIYIILLKNTAAVLIRLNIETTRTKINRIILPWTTLLYILNGDCMMMVTNTVHDHITSPVAFDNTYLFLIISDVRK